MKKAPLLVMIISTAVLLTVLAVAGYDNIYASQEQDMLKTPLLSRVFTALNDDIYPWQLFDENTRETARAEALERANKEAYLLSKKEESMQEPVPAAIGEAQDTVMPDTEPIQASPSAAPTASAMPTESPQPTATPSYIPRYEPLRESTYDEYISHISADIFGDAGVNFAAEYEFSKVDETYFDDALFIGDSRTVGLRDYTDLKEHADFLCETSLTVMKTLKSDFKGAGTVEDALLNKNYGKIYIMVGVNELGTGTTEDFIKYYTETVDRIHELAPEAKIIIQSIMNIDREKSTSDPIFNNDNIRARNNAIATLADNVTVFYIDINPAVCDAEGYLRDDIRGDHLHLMGASNEIWKEYLLEHGV